MSINNFLFNEKYIPSLSKSLNCTALPISFWFLLDYDALLKLLPTHLMNIDILTSLPINIVDSSEN